MNEHSSKMRSNTSMSDLTRLVHITALELLTAQPEALSHGTNLGVPDKRHKCIAHSARKEMGNYFEMGLEYLEAATFCNKADMLYTSLLLQHLCSPIPRSDLQTETAAGFFLIFFSNHGCELF